MRVPFKLARRLLLVWAGSSLSLVLVGGQAHAADVDSTSSPSNVTADSNTDANASKAAPAANSKAAAGTGSAANTQNADSGSDTSLGEVVVTAQRRPQIASEVPLALSVVTATNLANSPAIKQTNDVVTQVPNAQASSPNDPSRSRWFIRGIGTNNTGNNTINPIGIYYDDVYIANINNQGWPLFDLAQVEVLSGPQGTLWGKNSNGGAINYVSQAPKFYDEGYASLGYGSHNLREAQGAINGTLVDDVVAGRFAFTTSDNDGWQRNTSTGKNQGGADTFASRAQLLITPNQDGQILLNVHTNYYNGLPLGSSYAKSTVTPLTATTPTQKAFLSVYPTGLPSTGWGVTTDVNTSPDVLTARGANAQVNWDFGFAKLSSITAYEWNEFTSGGGAAPIPSNSAFYSPGLPFSLSYGDSVAKQYSQEFRLTSRDDQKFTWLAGLYAFDGTQNTTAVSANYVRGTSSGTANAWGTGPQYTDTVYTQDSKSYAIFGNLGYAFTDKFKISGGVRRSWESISIDWDYAAANTAGTAASFIKNLPTANIQNYSHHDLDFQQSASQSDGSWTYDFTPEYKFTDQFSGYARFAHGVLPGSYTSTGYVKVPGTNYSANQVYQLKPETLDSYEAGIKSSWFEKRLFVNLTAFYYQYTNLVVNVPTVLDPANPTVTTVLFRNAGAAEMKGLELRAEANPTRNFHLDGTLGYLDDKYTEDTGSTATILGASIPRSPRFTADFGATYKQFLPNGRSIIFAGDVNWRSKYYYYPTISSQITSPDPLLAQKAYALGNIHVRWNLDKKEDYALQFSVLNVTNTEYTNHALPVTNGSSAQLYGPPRSYELALSGKY